MEEQADLGPVGNRIVFRSRRLGFWNRFDTDELGRGTLLRVAPSTELVVDLERAWTPQPCNITGDGFASHGVHPEEEACLLCLLTLNHISFLLYFWILIVVILHVT